MGSVWLILLNSDFWLLASFSMLYALCSMHYVFIKSKIARPSVSRHDYCVSKSEKDDGCSSVEVILNARLKYGGLGEEI